MDCQNIGESTKMAADLYREVIAVPFMSKFVVFAKHLEVLEARLRVFCTTDDRLEKTLENQEHFVEVARSRDIEVNLFVTCKNSVSHQGCSQEFDFVGYNAIWGGVISL